MGTCIADYDNDGFQDVYSRRSDQTCSFATTGTGRSRMYTARAGVGDRRWSTNCAFGDYDRDGNLDLYVANYLAFSDLTIPKRGVSPDCKYMGVDVLCGRKVSPASQTLLYRNNGDGTFTDVTRAAGIVDPGYYGFGVIFSDLDDDGWPDIFVANDSVPNLLFRNNRDGTFSEIGLPSGVALNGDGKAQAGMGVDAGDYDGDGRLDIFVTNFSQDYNTLYQNSARRGSSPMSAHRAGVGDAVARLPGMGNRICRLRQRRPARSLRRQWPCLSRDRSIRPRHEVPAAQAAVPEPGQGTFQGRHGDVGRRPADREIEPGRGLRRISTTTATSTSSSST